ncbi:MAG: YggS family pyridoxal phosphate-dependent enzyme [Halioglobus sp.]|nr:YggS family pyridoxal phosphate-dependent enzyme [Halioglobus sp.]
MDELQLRDNIANVGQRLRLSAAKSQYGNSDILLVAVSKTRPVSAVRAAHRFGLTHFGENYLQEAVDKVTALEDLPLIWHFIGPIQSNKTQGIATHFDWVHSIDREKIATRLHYQRPAEMRRLQVCLQVNISGESSKSGVTMTQLPELARSVLKLSRLQLRGLMAIPAPDMDPDQLRNEFAGLRVALGQLRTLAPSLDTLSMGMSADMESAIAEGATMVRVGTAIFGPRNR